MNSINNLIRNHPEKLICGDVFEDNEQYAQYYILSECGPGKYCCINISTGGMWTEINPNIKKAVEGLKFVGRNLIITFEQEREKCAIFG